jgi:hypothetical protein
LKGVFCTIFSIISQNVYSMDLSLDAALVNVINNCAGISDELNDMKKMAGINTAVTGVGTLAGGGATAVGFVKVGVDKKAEAAEIKLTR